jgi:hypothetical protein
MSTGERCGLFSFLSLSLLAPSGAWAHQAPAAMTDPSFVGFLTSWRFRPDIILVVVVLVGAYTSG